MISLLPLALLAAQAIAPNQAAAPGHAMPDLKVKVGDLAPDFTVETPDGKPLKLSRFRGKVVVLDFWATWCGPCQLAMPGIQKAYERTQGQGVVVLAVNLWDDRKPFDGWMKANAGTKYTFTFGYDRTSNERTTRKDKRASSAAWKLYGVYGIPTTFVIDKDGRVAYTHMGVSGHEEERLVEAMNKLGVKTAG